jgi:hypothetical protein
MDANTTTTSLNNSVESIKTNVTTFTNNLITWFNEYLKKFNPELNKVMVKNNVLYLTLGMILILYSAKAAPDLPASFDKIFKNPIFKIVFMFLLAYITSQNPSVSLITAIVLYLSIQALSYYEERVSTKCKNKKLSNEAPANIKKYISKDVQLTDKEAEILSLLLTETQNKKDKLDNVENFGNVDLINKCRIEAFTAEAIMDATVNTIQYKSAVEEALKNGDTEAADALNKVVVDSKQQLDQLLQNSNLSPTSSNLLSSLEPPLFSEIGTLTPSENTNVETSLMDTIVNKLGLTNIINKISQPSPSTDLVVSNQMLNESQMLNGSQMLNDTRQMLNGSQMLNDTRQMLNGSHMLNGSSQVSNSDDTLVNNVPTGMDNSLMASVDNNNMLLENCAPQVKNMDICTLEKSNVSGYDNESNNALPL